MGCVLVVRLDWMPLSLQVERFFRETITIVFAMRVLQLRLLGEQLQQLKPRKQDGDAMPRRLKGRGGQLLAGRACGRRRGVHLVRVRVFPRVLGWDAAPLAPALEWDDRDGEDLFAEVDSPIPEGAFELAKSLK